MSDSVNLSTKHLFLGRIILLCIIGLILNFTANFSIILTYSLFLKKIGIEYLPYYYMVLNIFSILIGGILFLRNLSSIRWLKISTLLMGLIFLVIPSFLQQYESVVIFFIYVISGLFYIYSMIFYFNFVNNVLTIRETKDYIGWILGLSFSGAILSGLFTAPLLSAFSMDYCFILTGIIYILSLIPLIRTGRMGLKSDIKKETKNVVFKEIINTNFVKLFVAFIIISGFIKYFLDFQFSDAISNYFKDNKDLAGFYGTFNAISMTCILLSQILFTGKILKIISMSAAFKVISGFITVFSLFCIFYPSFWLIVSFQFTLNLILKIIGQPCRNVLLGAVSSDIRSRVRFLTEGIFYCLGVMLTGMVIAILNLFSPPHAVFFIIILILSISYFHCTGKLDIAYVEALIGNLKKKVKESREEIFNNIYNLNPQSGMSIFSKLLNVVEADMKLEALKGLSLIGTDEAGNRLVEAMNKERDPYILGNIIKFLGNIKKNTVIYNKLVEILNNTDNTMLKAIAIETMARWGEEECLKIIFPFIYNSTARIKSTAILAVLKLSGNEDHMTQSINELITMLEDERSEYRSFAIAVLGELGLECFIPVIRQFLSDPAIKVRRSSVIASLKLRTPDFLEDLSRMLLREDNKEIYLIINKAIAGIKNKTMEEMINIVTGLNFSDKHIVMNSIRNMESDMALKISLKAFCLEPRSLSIKFVELTGQNDKDRRVLEILQSCFTEKCFSTAGLIRNIINTGSLKGNMATILQELSLAGAGEIIAHNLAETINSGLLTEINDEVKKTCFYIAGISGLGIDTALGAFDNIMSGDQQKKDVAIEIIEAAVNNENMKNALLKLISQ